MARLTRTLRPRLISQATAAWAIFAVIGEIACQGDAKRTVQAFDAWDAAQVVGDLARRSGSSDAHAWRVVELARALLAIEPGALGLAVEETGLPLGWFESSALRSAAGWNEWQEVAYVSQEAWDEVVDAIAARDGLMEMVDTDLAAAELKRRAAAVSYRLDEPAVDDVTRST